MQIRQHGKQVLCIRTEYVAAKKRTVGVTVAKQESYLSTVSESVRRQLTELEVDQLTSWLSERETAKRLDRDNYYMSTVTDNVRRVTESLSVDGVADGLSQEWSGALWDAIGALQKALRKAGHPKPAEPKVAPSGPVEPPESFTLTDPKETRPTITKTK